MNTQTVTSTTRGLPFDPQACAAHRRRSQREAREAAARAAEERRAYGRMLDQMEAMWRQHERRRTG
jgi:hypothetical protein